MNNEGRPKSLTAKGKTMNILSHDPHNSPEKQILRTPEIFKYSKNDSKLSSFRAPTYEET